MDVENSIYNQEKTFPASSILLASLLIIIIQERATVYIYMKKSQPTLIIGET